MNQRLSFRQSWLVPKWRKALMVVLLLCCCADAAFADGTGSLDSFIGPLKNGLNLIMVFGFIAGCVMVMSGFSECEARRKLENDRHLRDWRRRCGGPDESLICDVRWCRRECGHGLLTRTRDWSHPVHSISSHERDPDLYR
jgi:hypothetical protein